MSTTRAEWESVRLMTRVLTLYYEEGRNQAQVAAELGLSLLTRGVPSGGDPVLRLLPDGAALGLDALREQSGLETPALLARLTELELRHEVRRLPGALFVRN